MSKVELITARQYLRRRDELFKRVGPATCQELIEDYQDQTETIFAMGQDVEEEEEQKQDAEQATSLFMSGPVSPSSEPVIRQNNAEQYTAVCTTKAMKEHRSCFWTCVKNKTTTRATLRVLAVSRPTI